MMDHLATVVDIPPFYPKITYRDCIVMVGSCFAEHMDRKLARYKYKVLSNPFGILYNPVSISKSFLRIAKKEYYHAAELVFHDGLYHSMDHHGSFSGTDPEAVLQKINTAISDANTYLKDSKFVFVSLGTSRIYRYGKTRQVVGNNHKIPATHFEAGALTTEECLSEMENIYRTVKQFSPQAELIWTVSPIRHLKDGLIENQRSKAVLILAIEKFIADKNESNYFPAYEIMMDQLRDYRFYARDLTHPSELAVDIIWDLFAGTYIDPHEAGHHSSIEKIKRAMEHRFLHDHKEAIRTFASSQLRNIDHLAMLFPEMNWKEERQYFFHLNEPD